MKKKSAIVMIIIYLVLTPVKGYCEAGSLVVAGGSIATGGLALAGTPITVPVLAAIGVGMTACGLNIELTKASQEAGLTKTQFILQKLEEYRISADKSLESINNTIADGISVTKDGTILLSNQASKQILQFGNWLFASNNVISPSDISSDVGAVVNGKTYPEVVQGQNINIYKISGQTRSLRNIVINQGSNIYIGVQNPGNENTITAFSDQPFDFSATVYNDEQRRFSVRYTNSERLSNGVYVGWGGTWSANVAIELIIPAITGNDLLTINGDIPVTGEGVNQDSFVGDKSEWDQNSSALSPSAGQTAINPDLLDKIITTVGNGFVGVNDYLRSIADAIDGIAGSIPITDTDTGTVITGDVPVTDSVPTIDVSEADPPVNPDPDTPEGTTPLVDPDKPATGASAIDPLKLPLKSFFPFCIPFDVKDMIGKLSASPVAPSYHVHWFVPIANQYLDFTVDLSGFNGVASICRKMELIAFVIGLAVVTRSMFIRG